MTLKILGSDDVTIRPFKVHKSQVLTYISGSDVSGPASGTGAFAELNVALAQRFPLATTFASGTILAGPDSGTAVILTQSVLELNEFDVNTSPQNEDGTFQEPLFGTLEHMFYSSGSESGSATFAAAGDGIRNFPLSESAYVVNIAQRKFGEGIRPGTFVASTPAGSGTIIDDSKGRLFVSGTGGSLNVVGNIFYNLGVATVNRLTSATGEELIQEDGMFFDSGSTIQVTFESTVRFFEYTIMTRLDAFEFNFSSNPTWLGHTFSGSVPGAGDDSGSFTFQNGPKVLDLVESGTLSPYITTIGLYNDRQELVAVARLPRPLKRLVNSQQSFIIRFDI